MDVALAENADREREKVHGQCQGSSSRCWSPLLLQKESPKKRVCLGMGPWWLQLRPSPWQPRKAKWLKLIWKIKR